MLYECHKKSFVYFIFKYFKILIAFQDLEEVSTVRLEWDDGGIALRPML